MTWRLRASIYTSCVMHERNDETLNRPAHGRSSFGTYDSERGLDRYVTEMSTPLGRVAVIFEGGRKVSVSVCHPEIFFRSLERTWNSAPESGQGDVHAKFRQIAASGESREFGVEQRSLLVSEFLHKAASALEALTDGQRAEVASLEEHAHQIRRESQGKEAL